ncbi:MAG TPA: LPS export ABC transporter ATP-binding protein [Kiritimatiellia bacterium]|nr:LPS export ABC transporter ATP-binding protein [Kiritimatiellia bacterium]HNR93032.1 LPS export ABC transporter ATP-binding protein [Kiritimatiellia bacterium]HNS80508.1 LPS export ABC transporter ATP-binding protein [Kiritimatiellia bacterium]HPA78168.1 LPS export ABC transporter ATP-binding protein [Kiritimatiellia bacterium]HQQ03903.1 LPS export ABC transporter ATP-binding protein [Kiritimatiellia bacterium]
MVTDSTYLVSTEELEKVYGGRRVVSGVNINVRPGEIVGLLGPNGAGKTTSFYMIMGLIRPTAGRVHFAGREVTRTPMYRRARMGMGYLSQEPSIFRRLTVEENVMAILETLPLSKQERRDRLEFLLNELKIAYLAKQRAYTLSGGERRRLEITRALVTSPTLILLDEPFSGVDPLAVYDVQQIIMELKEKGLGILITDHNVRETLAVVDRAYLLCDGKVLREGTREFLINDKVSRDLYLGPRFSM